MDKQWYVVNTYSGHENKVKEKLEMRSESMDMKDFYPVILNELLNLSSVNSFLRINRTRFFHTVNKGRSSRRFQLIHFEAISNSTFFHGRFIRAKQCVATDERDYIVAIFDLLTHQSISIHH